MQWALIFILSYNDPSVGQGVGSYAEHATVTPETYFSQAECEAAGRTKLANAMDLYTRLNRILKNDPAFGMRLFSLRKRFGCRVAGCCWRRITEKNYESPFRR